MLSVAAPHESEACIVPPVADSVPGALGAVVSATVAEAWLLSGPMLAAPSSAVTL